MSGPVQTIRVECPECDAVYADWSRGSVNLRLEGWDADDPEVQEYLRSCSTATCPECGHVVDLALLVVRGARWEVRA